MFSPLLYKNRIILEKPKLCPYFIELNHWKCLMGMAGGGWGYTLRYLVVKLNNVYLPLLLTWSTGISFISGSLRYNNSPCLGSSRRSLLIILYKETCPLCSMENVALPVFNSNGTVPLSVCLFLFFSWIKD